MITVWNSDLKIDLVVFLMIFFKWRSNFKRCELQDADELQLFNVHLSKAKEKQLVKINML